VSRFVPTDPRVRAALGFSLSILALLLVTQVLLPGPAGVPGRGTPWGTIFYGATQGFVTALSTAGIILVYRTLRVINFAQTTLGLAGAFLMFGFVQFTSVPFPIALVLGLALAGVVGAVVGVVLLRFFNASRLVLTVVTIIGAGVVADLAGRIFELPFFPNVKELPADQAIGAASLRPSLPFPGWEFHIGGQKSGFGFSEAFAIEFAILCLVALAVFFRYTRAGVAVRALAENPQRASLLGIGVGTLSVVVWTMAGVLSGASTSLAGMLTVPAQAGGFAPRLLLTAFVAAVLGRMERLPTGIFAAVAISVVTASWTWSFPRDEALIFLGLLLVLVIALLLQPRASGRSERGADVSWSAVEEQRPIPKMLASLAPVRSARWAVTALVLAAFLVLPFAVGSGVINTMSVLCLGGIVTVSIVVLTGWGGQVSLGQWGFAAIGAVVGGALTATVGLPFWIAVPLAAIVTGAFAAVVGLPALRIPGLFLLPVTFAFAVAVQATLFQDRYFGWLLPTESIDRPTLFLLDFRDERSMYFLCLFCLVVAITIVGNLRRSRTGRILIALRENEANVQSFGVAVVRTKLLAFAISGALAGFAGAVFVHQQQGLSVESFAAQKSVEAFVIAVFGGVGSVAGALLGTSWFSFIRYFGVSGLWSIFATGLGPLILVFVAPGGLISLANAARDSFLRVVAQRRQLVVPSLFADYDPDALEKRLIPLAEPDASSGLAALPDDVTFELPSELYRGRRAIAPAGALPSREADAIGMAAERITSDRVEEPV
jgi:branched-chain amino acid transport system permease protein